MGKCQVVKHTKPALSLNISPKMVNPRDIAWNTERDGPSGKVSLFSDINIAELCNHFDVK